MASECSKDGAVNALKGHRNLSGSNAEAQPGESTLTISSQQRANWAIFYSTGSDKPTRSSIPAHCRGRKYREDPVFKDIDAMPYLSVAVFLIHSIYTESLPELSSPIKDAPGASDSIEGDQ